MAADRHMLVLSLSSASAEESAEAESALLRRLSALSVYGEMASSAKNFESWHSQHSTPNVEQALYLSVAKLGNSLTHFRPKPLPTEFLPMALSKSKEPFPQAHCIKFE